MKISFLKKICKNWINYKQEGINAQNRKRLLNYTPTIISSNCLGGLIYHWLGLKFYSPFINLYFTNDDFMKLLENWEDFMSTEIVEDKKSDKKYPVGIGFADIRIHFMHYESFEEAVRKWNIRKERINMDNAVIMFSNFGGEEDLLSRFSKLPFKNKIVFTQNKYENFDCVVYLPGFKKYSENEKKKRKIPNIWNIKNYLTGERYIDFFDYVDYFNRMLEK